MSCSSDLKADELDYNIILSHGARFFFFESFLPVSDVDSLDSRRKSQTCLK